MPSPLSRLHQFRASLTSPPKPSTLQRASHRSSTMQSLRPLIILLSLLISSISAAAVEKPHQLNTVQDALIEPKAKSSLPDGPKAGATNSEAISSLNTKFNDVEVPPMTELTGDDLEKTTRDGYWFIKHYSPYCGHCKEIGTSKHIKSCLHCRHTSLSLVDLRLTFVSTNVANFVRVLLYLESRSREGSREGLYEFIHTIL